MPNPDVRAVSKFELDAYVLDMMSRGPTTTQCLEGSGVQMSSPTSAFAAFSPAVQTVDLAALKLSDQPAVTQPQRAPRSDFA